ncbi:Stb5p [Saccharomyces cerevisiae x Saccharomyces kudriavzevii VIN7]|uniref:Stb5p n=1 Tax=Saccharomyces cerevisiae x Saccharomyces kudriavzevii (strain VIN7) TaxID=1095631 RepID=H0GW04_SACCK|nr:Stb5p [Saccharomyces cerevisiae x Saccharomyces kudriavzevii VIN7]
MDGASFAQQDEGSQRTTQLYSCARCRKLKKKCGKQIPTCANCDKNGARCSYPGRAPRRTKKELADAMLRGEYVPVKRNKKAGKSPLSNQSMTASSSSASTNGGVTPGFSPYENDDPHRMKQLKPTDPINLVMGASPNSGEGVSSLISVLTSLNDSTNSSSHLSSNESSMVPSRSLPASVQQGSTTASFGGYTTPSPVISGSALTNAQSVPLENSNNNSANNDDNSNDIGNNSSAPQLNLSMYANHPVSNGRYDSVPVDASSIEFETLSCCFKGGRTTSWVKEDGSFKSIDRSLLDRFIAAYFKHNHRLFPMIDKIAFLNDASTITDFETLCDNKNYPDSFVFKVYMIMAIGCTTLQRAGMVSQDEECLSEHLAFLAMKKFRSVIILQDIETVRCLLLLGIYSFFEPKGSSSWTISGIIMRSTIGLGLNRELTAKKLKSMSAMEAEARYRVFWSAYCFERLVCTSLGRISGIDDEDITVPLPRALYGDERDDLEMTKLMISLRKMGGRIYKQVHSVSAGRQKLTIEQKQEIISGLRKELDDIYSRESERRTLKNSQMDEVERGSSSTTNVISFHSSKIWLAMRYSQLQILLYRPSALMPKPPIDSLSTLGEFCLQAWKHTYTLYKKRLLPLNWITLFRTLTICNTILYCLCQWSIDLIESKIEIQQCVEILRHFGERWIFAMKCADVFQNISNTILDISLSHGKVPNMDQLTRELFGASDSYQDILDENNVDVSWVDKLV